MPTHWRRRQPAQQVEVKGENAHAAAACAHLARASCAITHARLRSARAHPQSQGMLFAAADAFPTGPLHLPSTWGSTCALTQQVERLRHCARAGCHRLCAPSFSARAPTAAGPLLLHDFSTGPLHLEH